MIEKPEWLIEDAFYWYPELCNESYVDYIDWTGSDFDYMMLERYLVCETKQEALNKAFFMLKELNPKIKQNKTFYLWGILRYR